MPLVMLNPKVIWSSEDTATVTEGCLSVPFEFQGDVERPAQVTVSYIDLSGEEHTKQCAGLEACCVQHEIDHLNGILFISYLSRLRQDMLKRKTDKYLRRFIKGRKKAMREIRTLRKSNYRGKT
jgi:peptide deformylase